MNRKTVIQLVLSLGISAGCLYWLFRRLDFVALLKTTLSVHPLYYLAACFLLALMFLIRSLRWRILLKPCGDCSVKGLYSANLIGYMANNILPFRMGEFVRAYAAGQIVRLPATSVLASIVVERVLDGLGLCLVVFLTLLNLEPGHSSQYVSPELMMTSTLMLLALFGGVLILLVFLTVWPEEVTSLACGLAGRVSPRLARGLEQTIRHFTQGLGVLRQMRSLPMLMFYTLGSWAVAYVLHLTFLPALGLGLDPVMAGLALGGANLALTIPAAPGYLGTMQLGQVAAMTLGGAPQDLAIDYSLVGWAVVYFPITAAGLVEMWRQGMSLGGLKRRANELSGQK